MKKIKYKALAFTATKKEKKEKNIINEIYEPSESSLSYTLSVSDNVTTIVVEAPNAGGSLILDENYGTTVTLDNTATTLVNQTLSLHKGTNTITIA